MLLVTGKINNGSTQNKPALIPAVDGRECSYSWRFRGARFLPDLCVGPWPAQLSRTRNPLTSGGSLAVGFGLVSPLQNLAI